MSIFSILSENIVTFILRKWVSHQDDFISLDIAVCNKDCRALYLHCASMKCQDDFPFQFVIKFSSRALHNHKMTRNRHSAINQRWSLFISWLINRKLHPRNLTIQSQQDCSISFHNKDIFSNLTCLVIRPMQSAKKQQSYAKVDIPSIINCCPQLLSLSISNAMLDIEQDSNELRTISECSISSLTLENVIFPLLTMKSTLLYEFLVRCTGKTLRSLRLLSCMNVSIASITYFLYQLPALEVLCCSHYPALNSDTAGLIDNFSAVLRSAEIPTHNSFFALLEQAAAEPSRVSSLHTVEIDFAYWLTSGNTFAYRYFLLLLLSYANTNHTIRHVTLKNMDLSSPDPFTVQNRRHQALLLQCFTERWTSLQSLTLISCAWSESFFRQVFFTAPPTTTVTPITPSISPNSVIRSSSELFGIEIANKAPIQSTLSSLIMENCTGFTNDILIQLSESCVELTEFHLKNNPQIRCDGLKVFAQRHLLSKVRSFSLITTVRNEERDIRNRRYIPPHMHRIGRGQRMMNHNGDNEFGEVQWDEGAAEHVNERRVANVSNELYEQLFASFPSLQSLTIDTLCIENSLALLELLCTQHTEKVKWMKHLSLRAAISVKPPARKTELNRFQQLLQSYRTRTQDENVAKGSHHKNALFASLETADLSAIAFDAAMLRELLYHHAPVLRCLTLQNMNNPLYEYGSKIRKPLQINAPMKVLTSVSFRKTKLEQLTIRSSTFTMDLNTTRYLLRENKCMKLILHDTYSVRSSINGDIHEEETNEEESSGTEEWTETSFWRNQHPTCGRQEKVVTKDQYPPTLSPFFPITEVELHLLQKEYPNLVYLIE